MSSSRRDRNLVLAQPSQLWTVRVSLDALSEAQVSTKAKIQFRKCHGW